MIHSFPPQNMTVFVNPWLGIEALLDSHVSKKVSPIKMRRPKISQLCEGLPIITLKPAAESSQL